MAETDRLFLCELEEAPKWTGGNMTLSNVRKILKPSDRAVLYRMGRVKKSKSVQDAEELASQMEKTGLAKIVDASELNDEEILSDMAMETENCRNPELSVFLTLTLREFRVGLLEATEGENCRKNISLTESLRIGSGGGKKENQPGQEERKTSEAEGKKTGRQNAGQKNRRKNEGHSRNNSDNVSRMPEPSIDLFGVCDEEGGQKEEIPESFHTAESGSSEKASDKKSTENGEGILSPHSESQGMGDSENISDPSKGNVEGKDSAGRMKSEAGSSQEKNISPEERRRRTEEERRRRAEEERRRMAKNRIFNSQNRDRERTPQGNAGRQNAAAGQGNASYSSRRGTQQTREPEKNISPEEQLRKAENRIFQSIRPESELKREKSEFEKIRAKIVHSLQDSLIDEINKDISGFQNHHADRSIYSEMISMLCRSSDYQDFAQSWRVAEPNYSLDAMTEKIYEVLKERADNFFLTCSGLYLQN